MKAFSVIGFSKSGKTTTIENIIKELKKRRYSVGSIKEIHFEGFAMDQEGTNTDRHRKAGAEIVTARGIRETDILFPEKLSIEEILRYYDQDFAVLEGVRDYNLPKIITAHNEEEIEERLDDLVFAISGRISNMRKEYKGIPVINAVEEADRLVDLIEEKVYERLPDFPPECCSACGMTCRGLGANILRGKAKREDCILSETSIQLSIDEKEIQMVPFVQKTIYNLIIAYVKQLEGYKTGKKIEITIGEKDVTR